MKKRSPPRIAAGQVVVIPVAKDSVTDAAREPQPGFGQVTGETTKTGGAIPNGKIRIAGLTAPYLTFPMR